MNIDQTFVNVLFAVGGALSSFILYGLRDENNSRKEENTKLADRISELHGQIARDYVRRDDYRDDIGEIKGMLVRIFDKLDEKQDKPLG